MCCWIYFSKCKVIMDISVFSHDYLEFREGLPFDIRLSDKNGLVYLYCNILLATDISFFGRYGFSVLSVLVSTRKDFSLEVCLVPKLVSNND